MSEKFLKKDLQDKSAGELVLILQEQYGIEKDPEETSKGELVDLVFNAQKEAGEPKTAETTGKGAGRMDLGKKVRILIGEEEGERDYVFVGCNGRDFQIPRGTEVDVPQAIIEVLNNAVITKYEKAKDAKSGQMYMREKKVPRYNYQVVNS